MISVVMPVYNSEKFLSSAIESILNQSFSEFEFLIFNDASTDNSRQIINDYIKLDNRIKFHDSSINKGYSFWLNESLKYINYNYLARMDADDISDKFRFQKQYDFLLFFDSKQDEGILPLKFYEYLNTNKPIICVGGKPNSESKRILKYLKRGVVLDKKPHVIDFFNNILTHQGDYDFNEEKNFEFSYKFQSQKFEELLDEYLASYNW